MLCNSFIIAGLLDLSALPGFVRSRFFPAQVFLHICLDVIRYIMALFCSVPDYWRRWSPPSFESIGSDSNALFTFKALLIS